MCETTSHVCIIAERLSARLLILQCMFSVGGVWCHASGIQFVTLWNAICHAQECNLSHSGMHQKVVYAYVSQCCSGASGLIVTTSNDKSCDGSEEERARSLVRKQRRRQSVNAASMPWSLGQERWVWERAAAPSEAKVRGRLENWPYLHVLCGSKTHAHFQTLSM